jgi:CBS domain-containing protein
MRCQLIAFVLQTQLIAREHSLGGEAAMIVKQAMSSIIETIGPNTSIEECAHKMDRAGVGMLPVCQDARVVGVVTDRDICCRGLAKGGNPKTTTARQIMTSDVAFCREDQDSTEAARIMRTKHVRRLVVVDRNHAVVGLFSVDDLARQSPQLAGQVLEAAAPWPH